MDVLKVMCSAEELLPTRAHVGDAGLDIRADADLYTHHAYALTSPVLMPTGVRLDIPEGYVGLMSIRSSLGARGWIVPNAPGIIDAGYRGEIHVPLLYIGDKTKENHISRGDRIAQIVLVPVATPELRIVESFDGTTDREEGGFGSSGKE